MLKFDAKAHTYTYNGKLVPSVTQIISAAGLSDYSDIPASILKVAADVGTDIHTACAEFDRGGSMPKNELLAEYVQGWAKFVRDFSAKWQYVEQFRYNARYGYAGTPDRLGYVNDRWTVIDIKTGAPAKWHRVQTAGYAMFSTSNIPYRMAVYLKPGGYKIVEHKDKLDEQVFLSALTIFKFKGAK